MSALIADWPTSATEARDLLKDDPGYRALWIDGGVLYGDTDQGVVILWAPDEAWDPTWDL